MNRIIAVAAVLTLSVGCATKKHVRNQIDPVNQRVGQLEAKNKQTDASLTDLERGVSRADERAKGAETRASEAAQEAVKANEKAVQAGERAAAASTEANGAKSLAERGLAKTGELEGRLMNMDSFQLVATESVLFDTAQSKLTDESKEKLDAAVTKVHTQKRYVIEVQGFTDKIGTPEYNLELSRKRANEVVRYLTIQHKVPLHRVFVIGQGWVQPVADDRTSQGRKQNRRVEVRLYSADDALEGKKVTAAVSGGR